VDPSKALAFPGVKAYVDHHDVFGSNIIGPIFKDEQLFATTEVVFVGQTIGLVLAETQAQAQEAAKLVQIQYEELPVVVSIEQAIAANSFFPHDRSIVRGRAEEALTKCDHVIDGTLAPRAQVSQNFTGKWIGVVKVGGQEHFYLETQASLVIPKLESDEIEIWSSTQNPTESQAR
jgi:xanthine dehydrogenase/oxidase